MKKIIGIEMADNKNIYEITTVGEIEIKPEPTGIGFDIFIAGEESDFGETKKIAKKIARSYMIDDNLLVSGYGKYTGRKFWQLSQKLQTIVKRIANK